MANPTGKKLLKASLDLFREDKEMAALPVISVLSAFVAMAIVGGGVGAVLFAVGVPTNASTIVAVVIALFIATFAATTTSVAVVFAASERIEGGNPTVKGSLGQAWGRRRIIATWTLLATAIGVVLNLLQEKLGTLGDVLAFLGGMAWSVATFFVVPILAFEDLGPIDAVKKSSGILKARFGTVVRSQARFGFLFLGWFLLAVAALVGGFVLMAAGGALVVLGGALLAAGLLGFVAVAVYSSVVNAYLRTILYRYATDRSVPDLGIDLGQAFSG